MTPKHQRLRDCGRSLCTTVKENSVRSMKIPILIPYPILSYVTPYSTIFTLPRTKLPSWTRRIFNMSVQSYLSVVQCSVLLFLCLCCSVMAVPLTGLAVREVSMVPAATIVTPFSFSRTVEKYLPTVFTEYLRWDAQFVAPSVDIIPYVRNIDNPSDSTNYVFSSRTQYSATSVPLTGLPNASKQ